MRVHLGSDHAGLELKNCLRSWLVDNGHEPVDHGPFVYDANVISVGGRMHPVEDMIGFVAVFLTTPFSNDERHVRRIAQLSAYDERGALPPLPESALRDGAEGPAPV